MGSSGYPEALEELSGLLKALPGVGKRSAERMALAMLSWHPDKLDTLGNLLKELQQRVTICPECGHFAENGEMCSICSAPGRDHTTICVVEEAGQIINIEKTSLYRGLYHVLGGKLAPLEGKNPEDLNIESLKERIEKGGVREIVLALSSDVEGRATAVYLAEMFKASAIRITRIASGLPAGSSISYADSDTIAAAFSGRVEF